MSAGALARLALALCAFVLTGSALPPRVAPLLADARDTALAARGRQVYAESCAACHGRTLQGQPLWRMADQDRHRRSPALDGGGPAWLRSDVMLLAVISDGHYPGEARDARSRMPAFAARLDVGDRVAVLGFIKARWPVSLRLAQAALNPGKVAPPDGDAADWRFPADCRPR